MSDLDRKLEELIKKHSDYENCEEYHIHQDIPEGHIVANSDPNDGHVVFDEDKLRDAIKQTFISEGWFTPSDKELIQQIMNFRAQAKQHNYVGPDTILPHVKRSAEELEAISKEWSKPKLTEAEWESKAIKDGWVKYPEPERVVCAIEARCPICHHSWICEKMHRFPNEIKPAEKMTNHMTGQEWYDRFEEEMDFMVSMTWYDHKGKGYHEILDRNQIMEMAKKASGIS